MAWIIGRKPIAPAIEGTFVEYWKREPEPSISVLQDVFPRKFGGEASEYTFYQLTDSEQDKISDGWSYTLVWVNNDIAGIDLSNETAKPWVKLSATKNNIANDGVESSVITLEVWKPNLSSIATNVQRNNFRVTIETPFGVRYVRINIVNGIGTATFKTKVAGQYIFPADSKRYGTMRIFNQLVIDVDELTLLS